MTGIFFAVQIIAIQSRQLSLRNLANHRGQFHRDFVEEVKPDGHVHEASQNSCPEWPFNRPHGGVPTIFIYGLSFLIREDPRKIWPEKQFSGLMFRDELVKYLNVSFHRDVLETCDVLDTSWKMSRHPGTHSPGTIPGQNMPLQIADFSLSMELLTQQNAPKIQPKLG